VNDPAIVMDTGDGDRGELVLRERAMAAMSRAYAPYSQFRVGAALLGTDGSITEGCNVENAAFPVGVCAERVALGAAVARGNRSFTMIAIATDAAEPTPPCGTCRQALFEFEPQLMVVSYTRDGREARWSLSQLLPYAFGPASMGQPDDTGSAPMYTGGNEV
jgi:cytidine deaminase